MNMWINKIKRKDYGVYLIMADLIPFSTGIMWGPIIIKIMYYLGYALFAAMISIAMVAVYFMMQFKIKAETYTLYGSGNKGEYSFGKPKSNRIKKTKDGKEWRSLFPLFNKNKIEPFDQEYIYPGNRIKAFLLADTWVPIKISTTGDGDSLKVMMKPAPHYIRNWQSMKHKEHAAEFAEHNFWEDNKYFFMVLITAGLCLVMVGLTVYFTYNYATGGVQAMGGLTEAIRGFNTIGGIGPT